jgi:hypothetical protein
VDGSEPPPASNCKTLAVIQPPDMNDILKTIVSFISDKDRKLSNKTVWVTIVLFLIFALDFTFGFSVHYTNETKLDQIIKINTVLRDKSLDSNYVATLLEQRKDLINKKHPYKQLTDFFKSISFSSNESDTLTVKPTIKQVDKSETPVRNEFWFITSSGGYYLLLGTVFVLFFPFTSGQNSLGQKIAITIIMGLAMLFLAWFFYWLFGLIPPLFGKWTFNYWLNFVLQNIVIVLSVRLAKYYEK